MNNRFSFFEKDIIVANVQQPESVIPVVKEISASMAKYRCEQTVITQINGITANHAETKREFHIAVSRTIKGTEVAVTMVDNIINFNPPQLQEAISLLCEVDNIKCNVRVLVDENTGKIRSILNHGEIIARWKVYKEALNKKYEFIRDASTKQNLQNFIALAEVQVIDERQLIADLQTKLFFDIFFDKYLVQKVDYLEQYARIFFSQLFDGTPVTLAVQPLIMNETPDTVTVSKIGKLDRNKLNIAAIESMYNQRYKPVIQYKFSEFDFSYNEKTILNTTENLIQTAQVNIVEAVKNNVQVLISYSLKQIE